MACRQQTSSPPSSSPLTTNSHSGRRRSRRHAAAGAPAKPQAHHQRDREIANDGGPVEESKGHENSFIMRQGWGGHKERLLRASAANQAGPLQLLHPLHVAHARNL